LGGPGGGIGIGNDFEQHEGQGRRVGLVNGLRMRRQASRGARRINPLLLHSLRALMNAFLVRFSQGSPSGTEMRLGLEPLYLMRIAP
jgi:hypothetical protein